MASGKLVLQETHYSGTDNINFLRFEEPGSITKRIGSHFPSYSFFGSINSKLETNEGNENINTKKTFREMSMSLLGG